MKLPSIKQAYLQALRAAWRFPAVLLCALVAVVAVLTLIESSFPKASVAYPITLVAVLGVFLLSALALNAEKRKWSRASSLGSQLLGLLLIVGYAFTVPVNLPSAPDAHKIRFALLAAAFILLAMILPYLKKGEQNGFWQYNKILFFRLFVTAVFSVVLFAGLAIALAALDNLFGVSVHGKRYAELWVLVAGLFAPWFFISEVPEDMDRLNQIEEYPKGLKVFAQYILLSLVIVYLVILYAYLLKILMQWNWPKGWVSSLILGFSATSILSLLLMYPVRDRSGNAWIRAAGKWLYIVLVPLIVVLFLAVTERIGDYGFTERRYAGIALGVWLSAQVLYFLLSRSKSIKFTIGSLCLLVFLMSFGPWGMLSVARRSQAGRLIKLLEKNEILIDGKIHKEHAKVSQEDAQDISSIVGYLYRAHGYDIIQHCFTDKLKEFSEFGYASSLPPADILYKMGVEYFDHGNVAGTLMLTLAPSKAIDISGYDRLLGQQTITKAYQFDGDDISYEVNESLDTLTVTTGSGDKELETMQFDIGAFAKKLRDEYAYAAPSARISMAPDAMTLAAERDGYKVKLLFRYLHLIQRSGNAIVSNFDVEIAYSIHK
jgi:hypothetical protein